MLYQDNDLISEITVHKKKKSMAVLGFRRK